MTEPTGDGCHPDATQASADMSGRELLGLRWVKASRGHTLFTLLCATAVLFGLAVVIVLALPTPQSQSSSSARHTTSASPSKQAGGCPPDRLDYCFLDALNRNDPNDGYAGFINNSQATVALGHTLCEDLADSHDAQQEFDHLYIALQGQGFTSNDAGVMLGDAAQILCDQFVSPYKEWIASYAGS